MSPRTSKNIRVIAGLFFGIAVIAIIMMAVSYQSNKNRLAEARPVNVTILEYGPAHMANRAGPVTQLLVVEFTNPFTNQIVTGTSRLISYSDAEKGEQKRVLPVGAVTSSFFYPKDDGPIIASTYKNNQLPPPTDSLPFLGGAAVGTALFGALLWRIGKPSKV